MRAAVFHSLYPVKSPHRALGKGPGKRGPIVADTLLLIMFLGAHTRGTQNECCVSMLRKLGNICCGHKMFLNKIKNIFASRTQNLCPQQMLRENGETFVSATMCRQQCVLVCQGRNSYVILYVFLRVFSPFTQFLFRYVDQCCFDVNDVTRITEALPKYQPYCEHVFWIPRLLFIRNEMCINKSLPFGAKIC